MGVEGGRGGRRSKGRAGHTLDSGLNPSDNSPMPNSAHHSPTISSILSYPLRETSGKGGRDIPSYLPHLGMQVDQCRNAMLPICQFSSFIARSMARELT